MRLLLVSASLLLALLSGCGQVVGQCTAAVDTQMTTADGGTVTCSCKGPCGCFYADAGRCPQ